VRCPVVIGPVVIGPVVIGPVVIGRDTEIAALDEALDEALAGTRRDPVWVVGEAGIGKSRLLTELERSARAAGRPVVACRATPVDQRTPYRPLIEALLTVSRRSSREPSPAIGALLRGAAGSVELSEMAPVILAETAVRELGRLGGPGLLLIIEDLHWADPDTLAVVEYLVGHAAEADILLALSTRPPAPVYADRAGVHLELTRLDPGAARALAQACVPDSDLSAAEESLILAAEGLPLLVEDLLAAGPGGHGSPRFADLVEQRLDRLASVTRGVVETAALLGDHVDLSTLAGICELPADELADVLRTLDELDLLEPVGDGLSFRHALTRDAVLAAMPPPRGRSHAARAPAALERAGSESAVRAGLWEEAGELDRAMHALRADAARAAARGALATAELLQRRGLQLAPAGTRWRSDFTLGLARTLYASGQVPALTEQGRTFAAEMVSSRDLAALRLVLARAGLAAGDNEKARGQTASVRRVLAGRPGHRPVAGVRAAGAGVRGPGDGSAVRTDTGSRRRREGADPALDVAGKAGLQTWRIKYLNELGVIEMLRDARGELLEQALVDATTAGALGLRPACCATWPPSTS